MHFFINFINKEKAEVSIQLDSEHWFDQILAISVMRIDFFSAESCLLFGGELVDGYESPLPWQLEIARWLAPAVFLYTAGKAILFLLKKEYKTFLLRFYRDHIILAGMNERTHPKWPDISQFPAHLWLTQWFETFPCNLKAMFWD